MPELELSDAAQARQIVARLLHHAPIVEGDGYLNAGRWMREAVACIEYLLDAIAEATCEGCGERPTREAVADEWADDLAAAVIEQGRDL